MRISKSALRKKPLTVELLGEMRFCDGTAIGTFVIGNRFAGVFEIFIYLVEEKWRAVGGIFDQLVQECAGTLEVVGGGGETGMDMLAVTLIFQFQAVE